MKLLRRLTLVVGTVVWLAGCGPAGDEGWLGAPDEVADGVGQKGDRFSHV